MYKIERKYLDIDSDYEFDKSSLYQYESALEKVINEFEDKSFEVISYELDKFSFNSQHDVDSYPNTHKGHTKPYVTITVTFLLKKKEVPGNKDNNTRMVSYAEFKDVITKQTELLLKKIKSLESTIEDLTDALNEKQKRKKL